MFPASSVESLPGRLAENVVHFARVLRAAGVPVGTDRVLLALQALQVAGIGSRADFHAVLAACLIDRVQHRLLFEQAFYIFWKDPDLLGQMLRLLLPQVSEKKGGAPPPLDLRRQRLAQPAVLRRASGSKSMRSFPGPTASSCARRTSTP